MAEPIYRQRPLICALFLFTLAALILPACVSPQGNSQKPGRNNNRLATTTVLGPVDTETGAVVISDQDGHLLPVLVPALGRMDNSNRKDLPILLSVSASAAESAERFLAGIEPKGRIIIGRRGPLATLRKIVNKHIDSVSVEEDLTETAISLAQGYWPHADTVILADKQDTKACILAATLAAHKGIPYIPVETDRKTTGLDEFLKELKTQRVLFCVSAQMDSSVLKSFETSTEVISPVRARDMIVRTIGSAMIRNIIVVRAPENNNSSDPAWLASYMSLVRKSAVIVCRDGNPDEIEGQVGELVKDLNIQPKTITLLGDHLSIPAWSTAKMGKSDGFPTEVEPFCMPVEGKAFAYGVGRIPFGKLSEASLLFARGLVLERAMLSKNYSPNVLMIANPKSFSSGLPLAETISRASASEFRNFDIPIDEYYQENPDLPKVRESARKAALIIYQGHTSDQRLFEQFPSIYDGNDLDNPDGTCPVVNDLVLDDGSPDELETTITDNNQSDSISQTSQNQNSKLLLEGNPLFVLQSCTSLEQRILSRVVEAGGVGIVGTSSRVHSASGSSFTKCFCDQMLYFNSTVGEAVRDAKNFLLCVERMKTSRGHLEHAKTLRVAASFRLWGDPELRILPDVSKKSVLRPVNCIFAKNDTLNIKMPRKRLPESGTQKYRIRMYPNSQAAGIVKKIKDQQYRRILPLYFFRLAVPEQEWNPNNRSLVREGETDIRAFALPDTTGRNIYILYIPDKENKGESFSLRFK